MPGLRDNLKRWRDAADVDWFSQFIKAWIPFNAWMTDTFGDLPDRELLDHVKTGGNVVFNRIVPMLSLQLRPARDTPNAWQDDSPMAADVRLQVAELHRLLQACLVEGGRGRVSFETVDIGANPKLEEIQTKRTRTFRVRRDHPAKGEITLEISATQTQTAFALTLPNYDRRALEDDVHFQALKVEQRTKLLGMFDSVAPRRVITVLAQHGARERAMYGEIAFIGDGGKVFSALIEILYGLRNALFHGSITPNDTHNEIYKPAYHLVMRLVQATI
jgi:hypothetical protein